MALSVNSTIYEIMATEQGSDLLERYLPKLMRSPSFPMTCCMSFAAVCRFKVCRLSSERLAEAAAELEQITK